MEACLLQQVSYRLINDNYQSEKSKKSKNTYCVCMYVCACVCVGYIYISLCADVQVVFSMRVYEDIYIYIYI